MNRKLIVGIICFIIVAPVVYAVTSKDDTTEKKVIRTTTLNYNKNNDSNEDIDMEEFNPCPTYWLTTCNTPVYNREGNRIAMLPTQTVVALHRMTSNKRFSFVSWNYHGAIFSGWVFTVHIRSYSTS